MSDATPPPVSPAPPTGAAPVQNNNRTLIIVLCVVGGLLLLMGGCAVGCTYLVSKKAKEFAKETEKNPAYLGLTMLASFSPDIEIVSKDSATGIIKVRNKKSGEVVTIDTTQYTADNIGEALEKMLDEHKTPAKPATKAAPRTDGPESLAANLKSFPSYLPGYPQAKTLQAQFTTALGLRRYEYTALTQHDPATVVDFYEENLSAAGFNLLARDSGSNAYGVTINLKATCHDPIGAIEVEAVTQEAGQVQLKIVLGLMQE